MDCNSRMKFLSPPGPADTGGLNTDLPESKRPGRVKKKKAVPAWNSLP